MTKRVTAMVCILVMVFAAIPGAFAAGGPHALKFEVSHDSHGIDIKLAALVDKVGATKDQGFYEFKYVIEPIDEGGIFKILTVEGTNPPAYVRYTERETVQAKGQDFTLVTNLSTAVEGYSGPVPASDIIAAAGTGQLLRMCQQGSTASYIIKEITVTHIIDSTRTIVYQLSGDAELNALDNGATLNDVELAMIQIAGEPAVTLLEPTAAGSPSPSPSVAPTASPSPSTKPKDNEKTGANAMIPAALGILLLACAGGLFAGAKARKIQ